jgi:glycosyltransferase involved in cell wall biosynthesis
MPPISSLHLNTARSWRGGERQTLLLLEGLLRRGHQAALVCPPDTPLGRRATAEGIPVHALSMRGARDLMKFRHLVRELNPQIIQYHTAHAHSSGLLARIGLGTRSKTVVQRRVGFSIHRSGFPGLTHLKYGRSVDRFIVSSRQIARVLQSDGISEDRIEMIHDGVAPLPAATIDREQIRRSIDLGADAILIGSVGSLTREKGHIHLIDAMALLPNREVQAHLALVGDGEQAKLLYDRAKQHRIEDRIHLVGFQQQEQISSWLGAFDLYLQPSLEEGLCTSILDALNLGLPVVASDVGGIPEVIEDRVTGRLVAPADARQLAQVIDEILDDPTGADEMASQGARRARDLFSADAMVEGTIEVYRQLLETVPVEEVVQ